MRWFSLAFVALTSCLASPASLDAGADSPDAEVPPTNSACAAAGGSCVNPSLCVAQVGDVACGSGGAICCVTAAAATTPAAGADAGVDATTAPFVTAGLDAGGASTTTGSSISPGCDQTCESECAGNPDCIEACGC